MRPHPIVLTTDLDGRISSWNDEAAHILGRSAVEVVGQPLHALLCGDGQRTQLDRLLGGYRARGRDTWQGTVVVNGADGVPLSLSLTVSPLELDGLPAGLLAVGVDATRTGFESALAAVLARHGSELTLVFGADGLIRRASPTVAPILGLAPERLTGTSPLDYVHPEDHAQLLDAVVDLLGRPGGASPVRFRARHVDGTERHLEGTLLNLLDEPDLLAWVATGVDVTDRVRSEQALERSHRWFSALVEGSSDIISVLDDDATVRYASPSVERLLGYRPEEKLGVNALDLVHPDDLARAASSFAGTVGSPGVKVPVELRVAHANGAWREVELVAHNRLDDPAVAGVVLYVHDVTLRKEVEADLAHRALHDPLTDLPNRALFRERLSHALSRAARLPASSLAVLFVDLDGFKAVNDTLGHGAGDEVLVSVGDRLRAIVRPGDDVARLAGDEFLVLCEDVGDEAEVRDIAERIATALGEPYPTVAGTAVLSASVGAAVSGATAAASDPEDLLRAADAAMYEAKAGVGHCSVQRAA